ncbi:MAG: hypothetical protein MH252_00955 [Thermosynechococcaceae cyanobacterium MS004]|nr:hypothetical protein [Thermosynechococcaceae cyanobacterium MS004]
MAESFFLDPDEAKSMGDIDYMRTAKKVKKTFPATTAWGSAFEEEVEISATTKMGGARQPDPQLDTFQPSETPQPEASVRRKAASDLDLFRNMAKDIRKS